MLSYPSESQLKAVLYDEIKDYKNDYKKTLKMIKLELQLRERDQCGQGTKTEKKLLEIFRKWLHDLESEKGGKSFDKYVWFRNTVKLGKKFKPWW